MSNPEFQPTEFTRKLTLDEILTSLMSQKEECDDFYSNRDDVYNFAPTFPTVAVATPNSLSIDDAGVTINEFKFTMQAQPRKPQQTLVNMPSMVDATLVERRLAQLDRVMDELEATEGFFGNAELLLEHSWLSGYRATFLEQKGSLLQAADSYSCAVSVYDAAAQRNQLTAKSSPHIISFFHLLKRYVALLNDPRIPEELRDERRIAELRARINGIRESRKQWGMTNPDQDDEPFAYAKLILKVLCA